MVPFSSSLQIHLPGQLLTSPANSQDEDLVTWASNRSRFIDMWGWLAFSGAAVHRINCNGSLMFPRCFANAQMADSCPGWGAECGGRQFSPGARPSLVACAFSHRADHSVFSWEGRTSANLLPEPLPPPPCPWSHHPCLSPKSVKNQQKRQAISAATKALHLVVFGLPTSLLTFRSLRLGTASGKPS